MYVCVYVYSDTCEKNCLKVEPFLYITLYTQYIVYSVKIPDSIVFFFEFSIVRQER